MTTPTIIQAIENPLLLGAAFPRGLESWSGLITLLKGLFGLPLSNSELGLWLKCTDRKEPPLGEFKELWWISGRRSGKTFAAALIAVYMALLRSYKEYLAPGERPVARYIGPDRVGARIALNYSAGILSASDVLAQYVESQTKESLSLTSGVDLRVQTASYRTSRGTSDCVVILDEAAFYWDETTANPDVEILRSVRPSLATLPNSKLLVISTPYARRGILFDAFERYWGVDHPEVLCWKSGTREMNPLISQELIDGEVEKDASAAKSEWFAEWREDLEQFLTLESIRTCVRPGPLELAPQQGLKYMCFTDPSGGRQEAMVAAIGHRKGDLLIVDVLRGWESPFDPSVVVGEIKALCKQYLVDSVVTDRYGAAWVEESFRKAGLRHVPSPLVKSDLYLAFQGYLNSQRVELPPDDKLIRELQGLERRVGKTGKDSVSHGPRGRDDRANAAAGLCILLAGVGRRQARGRIRVVHTGGGSSRPQRVPEMKKEDLPYQDQVPIYHAGRLIGYERLTEDDVLERPNLVPVYEQGVLIRCDKTMRPHGARKRGIGSPVGPLSKGDGKDRGVSQIGDLNSEQ